jgi:hypothetical protein
MLEVDRFHLLAHDEAGELLLGTGFGQYRTNGVMDAITYAVFPGEQRVLRVSRRITRDTFADTRVGPLSFDVLEPLRRWRWRLEEPRDGLAFDLEFTGTYEPFLYRTFDFAAEGTSESRFNHYIQVGRVAGTVEVDGHAREVDLVGIRDRSWGVRAERERQGLHFWVQTQLDDAAVCFVYNEHRDGSQAYLDGVVVPRGGEPRTIRELRHRVRFQGETRVPSHYEFAVVDESGAERRIAYEPLLTGFIGGLGYGGWHGQDRGDYYEASERADTRKPVEEVLATQPILVLDQVCRITSDGRVSPGNVQFGITRSSSYAYRPTLAPA